MPSMGDYDLYVFDCDGVILDSNQLKIEAMGATLRKLSLSNVDDCLDYFSKNFGKSRYHHAEYFLRNIIGVEAARYQYYYDGILDAYGALCDELYRSSNLCEGVVEFLEIVKGPKFVASGSEQGQLRAVLDKKGLSCYFEDVLGSPETKSNNVRNILGQASGSALMVGDSLADLQVAREHNMDFLFVSKYSASPGAVRDSDLFGASIEIETFRELVA